MFSYLVWPCDVTFEETETCRAPPPASDIVPSKDGVLRVEPLCDCCCQSEPSLSVSLRSDSLTHSFTSSECSPALTQPVRHHAGPVCVCVCLCVCVTWWCLCVAVRRWLLSAAYTDTRLWEAREKDPHNLGKRSTRGGAHTQRALY